MRREQTKNKWRIIIGSALTLASVCFILLALLVWLLSPSPHLKPTTIAAKASKRAAAVASGSPADHRNYSRFSVVEQDEEASANGVEPDIFRPEFATGVSSIVIAVGVVVLLVVTQIARRGPLKQEVTAEGGGPFCCPDDMWETLRYINTSVNLCRDFFTYACSGVINNRLWLEDNTEAELERMVFT
ncbi:hypothetical protein MRX96_007845 [Rhipicephalus microplus]